MPCVPEGSHRFLLVPQPPSPRVSVPRSLRFGYGERRRRSTTPAGSLASACRELFAPPRESRQARPPVHPLELGSGPSSSSLRIERSNSTVQRSARTLGSGRIHIALATAFGVACFACGRCFAGPDPASLATAAPCHGWAPFLTAAAAHALRSASATAALSALAPGHSSLAAARRRRLGLGLPEVALETACAGLAVGWAAARRDRLSGTPGRARGRGG